MGDVPAVAGEVARVFGIGRRIDRRHESPVRHAAGELQLVGDADAGTVPKDSSAPGALELVRSFVNSIDLERPETLDAFADLGGARVWLADAGLDPAGLELPGGDVAIAYRAARIGAA